MPTPPVSPNPRENRLSRFRPRRFHPHGRRGEVEVAAVYLGPGDEVSLVGEQSAAIASSCSTIICRTQRRQIGILTRSTSPWRKQTTGHGCTWAPQGAGGSISSCTRADSRRRLVRTLCPRFGLTEQHQDFDLFLPTGSARLGIQPLRELLGGPLPEPPKQLFGILFAPDRNCAKTKSSAVWTFSELG